MADTRERLIIEAIIEGNAIQRINTLERETLDYAKKSRTALEGVEQGFNEVGRSATRAGVAVDRGMKRAGAATAGFRKSIGALVPGIRTLVASLVGISAVSGATRSASEYQIALAEVGTIAGLTADQLQLTARATQEVTQEFAIPAIQGIKAQYQAISAGVEAGAESTIFLAESSRLAIAGVTDLTSAVSTLTSITNAYGREFGDAAEVSDILFNTVRLGVTTIPELSSVIGDVIPPAAALGIELEQVFAAIAALTKSGASTAEVGTQLKAVFTQLANSTSATAVQLAKFGVPVGELRSDFLGLLDAIAELSGDEIAQAFGSNVRAFLPILNLTGQLRGDFVSFVKEIENGGGAVERALQQFFETPAFQARKSINQFKDAFRTIGDGLIDGFNEAVSRAGGADVIAKQIESFGSVFGAVATEVLNVVAGIVSTIDGVASRAGGIDKLTDAFRKFFRLVGSVGRAVLALIREILEAVADAAAKAAEVTSGVVDKALGALEFPDVLRSSIKRQIEITGGVSVDDGFLGALGEIGQAVAEFIAALDALEARPGGTVDAPEIEPIKFPFFEELLNSEGYIYKRVAQFRQDLADKEAQRAADAAKKQQEIINAAAEQGVVAVQFQTDAAATFYASLIQSISEFGLRQDQQIALQLQQSKQLIAGLKEEDAVRRALTVRVEEAARIQLAAAAASEAQQARTARTQEDVQRRTQQFTLDLFEQGLAFEDAVDAARIYGDALRDGVAPAIRAAQEAAFDWADAQNSANLTAKATTAAFDTVSDGLGSAFADIVTGAKSAEDAIKSFVASALAELSRLAAQAAFRNLFSNIIQGFAAPGANLALGASAGDATVAAAATGTPTIATGPGSVPRRFYAAGGGITRVSGFSPISRSASNTLLAGGLPGYANGSGPISSPHLAVVGEGRFSEFVVPTPDGRSIPVKQVGGSGSGRGDSVNVTINMNLQSMDPSRAADVIGSSDVMRRIEDGIARSLTNRSNRNLSKAVANS